jgi:hypothetical protein
VSITSSAVAEADEAYSYELAPEVGIIPITFEAVLSCTLCKLRRASRVEFLNRLTCDNATVILVCDIDPNHLQ